jgi:hypothetical protein
MEGTGTNLRLPLNPPFNSEYEAIYEGQITVGPTVDQGLTILKAQDPIAFDGDCREGVCGACCVMINGLAQGGERGTTVCQLYMRKFKDGDVLWLTYTGGKMWFYFDYSLVREPRDCWLSMVPAWWSEMGSTPRPSIGGGIGIVNTWIHG